MKIKTVSFWDHKCGTSIELPFMGGKIFSILIAGAGCCCCFACCCCSTGATAQQNFQIITHSKG